MVALKPPYFIIFFDCMHFSKIHIWPKTTEKMKIARKQKKIVFFCAQNINYGYYGISITSKILVYHFRGISHFGPSVRRTPLVTETSSYINI